MSVFRRRLMMVKADSGGNAPEYVGVLESVLIAYSSTTTTTLNRDNNRYNTYIYRIQKGIKYICTLDGTHSVWRTGFSDTLYTDITDATIYNYKNAGSVAGQEIAIAEYDYFYTSIPIKFDISKNFYFIDLLPTQIYRRDRIDIENYTFSDGTLNVFLTGDVTRPSSTYVRFKFHIELDLKDYVLSSQGVLLQPVYGLTANTSFSNKFTESGHYSYDIDSILPCRVASGTSGVQFRFYGTGSIENVVITNIVIDEAQAPA